MRRLLMILPLLLVVGEAAAMGRYDMSKMSCEEVKGALQSERSTILESPSSRVPRMMRFEKYVDDRQACGALPSWAQPAMVKTANGQSCAVYRCMPIARSTPRY